MAKQRRKPGKTRPRRNDGAAREAAIRDILRVISSSPADQQPVFDTILSHGIRLCGGSVAVLWQYDGTQLRFAAHKGGSREGVAYLQKHPLPLGKYNPTPQAALERRTVHVADVFADRKYRPLIPKDSFGTLPNAGTVLAVPLLRQEELLGVVTIWRFEKRLFSRRQIQMVETFAAQAVIAIHNVRLHNETKQALEQQTATAEILQAISQSPTDTQPVFEAIARNAARLCNGIYCAVFRIERGLIDLVAHQNFPAEGLDNLRQRYPAPLDVNTGSARAARERRILQLVDVENLPDTTEERRQLARVCGYRTQVFVPMLREDVCLGVLSVTRPEPEPFPDQQTALLRTFADQAVIAIENVRLFNETKEALEQQTAISEILRVISASPTDVQPMLDAVAERAARICEAKDARVFVLDGPSLRYVAGRGDFDVSAGTLLPLDGSIAGRAVTDRVAVHVDMAQTSETEYPFAQRLYKEEGYRIVLAVPLLRESKALGVIVLRRKEAQPFTEKQVALLKTFADQAAIAIENVRLFNETREALERQTATSEVLRVISQSQTDTQPVFDAIIRSAVRLCAGTYGSMVRVDGDTMRLWAHCNYTPEALELVTTRYPAPVSENSLVGLAVRTGEVVHSPDRHSDPRSRETPYTQALGIRAQLTVPLLRDRRVIGTLNVLRKEAGPFTEEQIDLLKTFADQAVIAIENVRLFNEIQEKSRQLEVANKHKSDFLANMSHELRTPLNAIIGFSEALMEKMFGELNDKQADYLKDIHDSGKHLLSLINDILDLSKIEAGRMDLEVSSFHLPTALSNAMTLVRERAQRHAIELGLEVDERLGEFQADERKFKQIMLNLLSNAVKFTPDGGRVDVCARKDTDKIEIAVKDTGIGIAPEDQAAVFEEFKQVGRDYTKKAEGTGLGLALTRRFVELHGGAIRLESTPGKGSTFTVSLPLQQ